jgi:hypothetical protein
MRLSRNLLLFILILLAGCSTNQTDDKYEGSTEQRLVTHSINNLMKKLPEYPISQIRGKRVYLQTHFIKYGALIDYATSRLQTELSLRYHPIWETDSKNADYSLDVYFTSLGTDQDSLGISLPLPVQGQGTSPAKIPILNYEMFHGISEMYLYLTDLSDYKVSEMPILKSVVRDDKIATPIITLPVPTGSMK